MDDDKQQKRKDYMREYREKICKKIKLSKRLHYEENRKSILEVRSKNREGISVRNHEYYVQHRDERRRSYAENRHVVNNRLSNKNVRIVERHVKSGVMGSPNFVYPIANHLDSLSIEWQLCKAVFFKDEVKKSCCHYGKLSHLSI
jgi:hypothetical protein